MSAVIDWVEKRDTWIEAVARLCSDVENWANAKGWTVVRSQLKLEEEDLGPYTIDSLMVAYPGNRIHLEPVARNIAGGDGRVDLLAFPTMNNLLLIRKNNEWQLYTDSRIRWPEVWGPECFYKVVELIQ